MPDAGSAPVNYPEGVVLIDTRMYYGEISYDDEDVQSWDQRWRPSEKAVRALRRDWRSIPVAKVSFITNNVGRVNYTPVEVKTCKDGFWSRLCALFTLCLRWCFEKIKACVIGCFWLIWAMLMGEKWQNRRL